MPHSPLAVSARRVVTITYEILDQQGNLFEKSDLPVNYVHGSEHGLYLKVEQALTGHVAGDEVSVALAPQEGFGAHDPGLTFTDALENVPPQFHQLGAEVEFENERGEKKTFYVTKIDHDSLTIDGNHPLAGQTVTFKIKIIEVRKASEEELRTSEAAPAVMTPDMLQ